MKNRSSAKWLVLAVLVLAYMFAVINRSSFSTLGTVAQQHFGAEATVVSLFITVQILVYTLAQIPVGIFLDVKGAATVMTSGLLLMGIGQLLLGQSDTVPWALVARLLVGAGDACIFTCMVKVISEWFVPSKIPTVNQFSGLLGQSGQLVAVAPLAALVGVIGWSGTFSLLGMLGFLVAALVILVVRNSPAEQTLLNRWLGRRAAASGPSDSQPVNTGAAPAQAAFPVTEVLPVLGPESTGIFAALKSLLKRPGVRMAFWAHWATGYSTMCFTLLWGAAFMTGGLKYSFSEAAGIVSTVIFATMIGGLITGPVLSRFARWRVHIAVVEVLLNLGVWALIVFWQGETVPYWLMTISAVLMGLGGPISMVAFELVRSYAPLNQRGIAMGLANMGGFTACLICVFAIGVLLDLQGAGSPETYAYEPFKRAMSVIIPVGLLGVIMILWEYPKTARYVRSKTQE